jgi:hypothetical protein
MYKPSLDHRVRCVLMQAGVPCADKYRGTEFRQDYHRAYLTTYPRAFHGCREGYTMFASLAMGPRWSHQVVIIPST